MSSDPETPTQADPSLSDHAHLSFSGGGFLGIYHAGVLQAFKDFAPEITTRKVLGASSGALASCFLVCDLPVERAVDVVARMAVHCRSLSLGPLDPGFDIFNIMRDGLEKCLPEDAHIRCSGRMFISVTRAFSQRNEIISVFDSREELINAVMASCFIPYFLGIIAPRVKGVFYIDGGFSVNEPVHDEFTVTVSPFPNRGTVIRPRKEMFPISTMPSSIITMYKTVAAPPLEKLIEICQQGYEDAVHYLRTHNLLSCRECSESRRKTSMKKKNKKGSAIACSKCDSLISLSRSPRMEEKYLKPFIDAAAAERKHRELHPLVSTRAVQTLIVLFSLLALPITSVVTWALRVYRYLVEHSTFVGYVKQITSQNETHLEGSEGRGKSFRGRSYPHS
ncbi:patanin-like phospholipase domain-containing protein [Galendromus occidentalis]|uniref:Patanin-like phospholipase domain-containing protein n=1 Tax=Galendromus occidentalis TaxID=34638 RepID=A0AAJ6QYF6_9ACAR|nr:patanin-like phospholipase domain-containing protein [Galendromus occidentalis]